MFFDMVDEWLSDPDQSIKIIVGIYYIKSSEELGWEQDKKERHYLGNMDWAATS